MHSRNYFVFAGKRSADFGLFVEASPNQPKPKRKVKLIDIPGRNGALRIDQGGYQNIAVTYQCAFLGGPEKAAEVAEWLYGSGGTAIMQGSSGVGLLTAPWISKTS